MSVPLRRSLAIMLLLASAWALGCAEQRSPADVEIRAHPKSWSNPASDDFHGAIVADRGTSGCTGCHGEDHLGQGRATSCVACHAHPDQWLVPASEDFHGRAVAAGRSCDACHGADLGGGWADTSCFTCHPGPSGHPEGWLSPPSSQFHGTRVRDQGTAGCATCHGSDLRGGSVASTSCFNACHDGPGGHPDGWVDPGSLPFHGATVNAQGTADCVDCHGASLEGGWSGVSCASACHAGAGGHPEGWMNSSSGDFHGDTVAAEGASGCASCHGADFLGGWTTVSCYTCHDGVSGHPSGWSARGDPFHGTTVIEGAGPAGCTSCHGPDLRGGWSELGCYDACHDGPSGHPFGWLDSGSIEFHGELVASESAARCQACHGEDLRGDWAAASCYAPCHDGPGGHPPSWDDPGATNFHGQAVADAGGFGDCLTCHGSDALGGWTGVDCFTCHDGPAGHPADWATPDTQDFHGQAVIDLVGYDTCKPCHGENVDGGWSNVSCYGPCHDGPGGHPVGWYNPSGPLSHDEGYYATPPGYCDQCHIGLDGGWTGVGCNECH